MSQVLQVTVPLMILVSLGVCNVIRQYDLSQTESTRSWITRVPFTNVHLPGLGPFIVLHGANHLFILYTFSTTLSNYQGGNLIDVFLKRPLPLGATLGFILCLYLLILPVLEVTEYQDIPGIKSEGFPLSLQFHGLMSILTVLLMVVVEYLYFKRGPPGDQAWVGDFPWPELQMGLSIILFPVIAIHIFGYVLLLAKEINDNVSQKGQSDAPAQAS